MKIALIFAMEAEAQPLVEALQLKCWQEYEDPRLPFRHYLGRMEKNTEVLLSINGKDSRFGVDNIGTIPAALNSYVTLSRFLPDVLINAGTAGGFLEKGAAIGDVYLSQDAFRFHDRRIPYLKFEEYGIGHFPTTDLSDMALALGLKCGVVTTSDSLDCTHTDMERMKQNQGSVKEMEAAAIAWIAYLLKTPFFSIKAITDLVDTEHTVTEQFSRNLEMASRNLCNRTIAVLNYIIDHPELLKKFGNPIRGTNLP